MASARCTPFFVLVALASPVEGLAQDEARPPELVTFVEADYPGEALELGLEAEVVLTLRVDETGKVTGVEVTEPAGHGFDEAAAEAAGAFVFAPATVDGEPVASEVAYRYRFFLEKAARVEEQPTVDEEPGQEAEAYVTVVSAEKVEPPGAPKHVLGTQEVLMMPGTGGDLLRSVQNLPGVARAPGNAGILIIRGSAPEDSLILMDDHPIPLAYHFGGMSSVINAEFIDQIEYVPGNMSARYGRGTGGLINVKPKWAVPPGWHVVADLDSIDVSLWTYGPIGTKGFVGGSVRRSFMDIVLKAGGEMLEDRMDLGATAVPVYWDYQLFAMYAPRPGDELRLSVVGDGDSMRLLFDDPWDDPGLTGYTIRNTFHVAQLQWIHEVGELATYRASLQAGWVGVQMSLGRAMDTDVDSFVLSHRQSLGITLGKWAHLEMGIDLQPHRVRTRAIAPEQLYDFDTFSSARLAEVDSTQWQSELAAYAELRLEPALGVIIEPGVRIDHHGSVDAWEPQPRLVVRYSPVDITTLMAGAGVYTQAPALLQVSEELGNPDLMPMRAVHYVLGVKQDIEPAWLSVSLQLFAKSLDRVAEPTDDHVIRDGELVLEHYADEGRGRAYGMELMLRIEPGHFVYGWLAYTLSRSERWSRAADRWIPFSWDQPHLLTLVLGFELPRGFNISLRYRVASGNPYEDVVRAVFDADHGTYVPVYEPTPTRRMPTFHALDLRMDKTWEWRYAWLKLFVDITNVYYSKNPEFAIYNYDYSERKYINGLPIIPSVGVQVAIKASEIARRRK